MWGVNVFNNYNSQYFILHKQNKMKKLLILIISIVVPILANATITKALTVTTIDGKQQSIPLTEYPVITMSGDKLLIKTPSADYQFDLQNVDTFLYEDIEISGISEVTEESPNLFWQDGNTIYVKPATEPMQFSIVSANGIVMHHAAINAQTTYSVLIQDYPQGAYIVTLNSVSYKIIKR